MKEGAIIAFLILLSSNIAIAQYAAPYVCPSDAELNKQVELCKAQGLGYLYDYDAYKCRIVKCAGPLNETGAVAAPIEAKCPAEEELNASINQCEERGLPYKIALDKNNCRTVQCLEQEL